MKKIIRNVIIVIYAVIAIFVTICLLSYNQYKVTEFGSNSLIIVNNKKLEPDFNKGDLVIVDSEDEIKIGDKVFFYNTYENEISVSVAEIIGEEKITDSETTYTLEGDKPISSEYVIGSAETSNRIGVLGSILGILESKWGFLFLVVLPSLLAFIYEIVELVIEVRKKGKNDEKSEK